MTGTRSMPGVGHRPSVVSSPVVAPVAAAGGLAVDGRDLAGLHDLLEVAEVFADLGVGLLAEQPGDRGAEAAGGGLVHGARR